MKNTSAVLPHQEMILWVHWPIIHKWRKGSYQFLLMSDLLELSHYCWKFLSLPTDTPFRNLLPLERQEDIKQTVQGDYQLNGSEKPVQDKQCPLNPKSIANHVLLIITFILCLERLGYKFSFIGKELFLVCLFVFALFFNVVSKIPSQSIISQKFYQET